MGKPKSREGGKRRNENAPPASTRRFGQFGRSATVTRAQAASFTPDKAYEASPGVADIVWRMVVCGAGFGFFQAPNLKALMSSAPPGRSGSASSIIATGRLTGQTLGAALTALCFGLAGTDGATAALALGAGFAALGSLMSFLRLTVGRG